MTQEEKEFTIKFETLIKERYGYSVEAIMYYLFIKVIQDIDFYKQVNESLIKGIHNKLKQERRNTQDAESVAIAALHIVKEKDLKLKKNRFWIKTIKKYLKNFKFFLLGKLEKVYYPGEENENNT